MCRNKKDKTNNCAFCKNEFLHYSFDNQEYCSRECYYNFIRSKRPIHNCTSCGLEIKTTKYRHTRNEEYYCNKECYNNRRKEGLKRLKRDTTYFSRLVEKGCECGVNDYYLLQIHHKDGNKNNNSPENHEVVCANCHIKRHLKVTKNGKLVYHPSTLTSDELYKSLKNA